MRQRWRCLGLRGIYKTARRIVLAHAVRFVMVWDAGVCPAQINASASTLEK